jgi:hypothetical protein
LGRPGTVRCCFSGADVAQLIAALTEGGQLVLLLRERLGGGGTGCFSRPKRVRS